MIGSKLLSFLSKLLLNHFKIVLFQGEIHPLHSSCLASYPSNAYSEISVQGFATVVPPTSRDSS